MQLYATMQLAASRRMTVVEVPKRNPSISSGSDPKRDYAVGDTLNLTCVSAPSNPPAQLEWRLNGRPVGSVIWFRSSFQFKFSKTNFGRSGKSERVSNTSSNCSRTASNTYTGHL